MPSKPVRPNQFGITLSDEAAETLRSKAARLKTPPATLAAQLLEEALTQRRGVPSTDQHMLREIRRQLSALADDQYAATVKILSTAGGMSGADIERWAARRLKK